MLNGVNKEVISFYSREICHNKAPDIEEAKEVVRKEDYKTTKTKFLGEAANQEAGQTQHNVKLLKLSREMPKINRNDTI
jgi:preprotein translocase subunit SecA